MEFEVKVSKYMSFLLRHNPHGLEMGADGSVDLDELLARLRERYRVDKKLILDIVEGSEKRRFEVKDNRIRALYGHSIPVTLGLEEDRMIKSLYHGTTPSAAPKILKEGLKPMKRRWVHLSPTVEIAREVGMRRTRDPVVLEIDSETAVRNGIRFYKATDKVYLCSFIPPQYVKMTGGQEKQSCLKKEVGTPATQSDLRQNVAMVDKGIVNIVRKLNSFGFETIGSCSSLFEDHLDSACCRSVDPYVCVAGKHPRLIEVAEQSGWDWWLDGKSYTEDGETPLDHVNFYSSGGDVYKSVNTARELRVHQFWHLRRIPSSKEEAIRCQMPVKSTTLTLSTDLSTVLSAEELVVPDEVMKKRIRALERAIGRLSKETMPKQA